MTANTPAYAHAYQFIRLTRHIPVVPSQKFRLPAAKARYPHLPNIRTTTRDKGNDFQGWAWRLFIITPSVSPPWWMLVCRWGRSFAPVTRIRGSCTGCDSFCAQSNSYVLPTTSATVATGVNLDVTGFVSPLFSRTAVEGSASQVVDPVPPAEEFALPVFYQVRQEQSAAGEMTENTMDSPVVQEQVIVQTNSPCRWFTSSR